MDTVMINALPAASVLTLVSAFFASFQVKTLIGLIFIDVILGVAAAIRQGRFQWSVVAQFYRTMVLPYVLGYLALVIGVEYLIPPEALAGFGDIVNKATVTLAWGALVMNLLASIKDNLTALYQGK